MVSTYELGVAEDEGRTQSEGNQQNQGDRCQAVVRDRFPLPASGGLFGAVACKKPCLKAQCLVKSIQPLFSFFQRLCPSWRTIAVGKDRWGSVVTHSHSWSVEYLVRSP